MCIASWVWSMSLKNRADINLSLTIVMWSYERANFYCSCTTLILDCLPCSGEWRCIFCFAEPGGNACSAAYRPLCVNSTNGRITSPNHPENYYNNADCQWLIDSGSTKKVRNCITCAWVCARAGVCVSRSRLHANASCSKSHNCFDTNR